MTLYILTDPDTTAWTITDTATDDAAAVEPGGSHTFAPWGVAVDYDTLTALRNDPSLFYLFTPEQIPVWLNYNPSLLSDNGEQTT